MARKPGIFPTFFLSGFECSTFLWKDGGGATSSRRRSHREHAAEDYAILRDLGIAVAREGMPWPMVDKRRRTTISRLLDPCIEAMNAARILPIWDLCHYGYPDDARPVRGRVRRRASPPTAAPPPSYVVPSACAGRISSRRSTRSPSSASAAANGAGWRRIGNDRDDRVRLRLRAVPGRDRRRARRSARSTPRRAWSTSTRWCRWSRPRDRPDLAEAARARDLRGHLPRLGHPRRHASTRNSAARPEILDIVGVNNYSFGQMEYREQGPHAALDAGDDRIAPAVRPAGARVGRATGGR